MNNEGTMLLNGIKSGMEELLSRLDSMTPDEVSTILREALDDLGIAYTVGDGAINFEDIFPINKNGVERLSGDYIRGYTKAIMDLKDVFNYVNYDLRHHRKKWTKIIIDKLLNCCIRERENIREDKEGFIRYNGQKRDFEFFEK